MIIPEKDKNLEKEIEGKIPVIYLPNYRGEFPHNFNKQFIPSSITIDLDWYIGYTNNIMYGLTMYEIPEEILIGLQFFNIEDGMVKKYDKFGNINLKNEKKEIILTEEELTLQLNAKKFLFIYELTRVYDEKINELYSMYGAESKTWDIQIFEAKEYIQNNQVATSFLKMLSDKRQIPLVTLVNKIIEKHNMFNECITAILGEKQKLKDVLKSINDNMRMNDLFLELKNV